MIIVLGGKLVGYALFVGDPGSDPGSGRFPEKGVTTHSSILVWRIPWEPGRLQTMGSQRVRHG